MWENSHSERRKFLEDVREQGSIVNFKEQAGFGSQSHDFSENVPHILDEERIDERVHNFSMFIPWMFLQDNMILHEEMRNIIIQIHIL